MSHTPGRGATTTTAGARELLQAGMKHLLRGQEIIGKGYIISGLHEVKRWHPDLFEDPAIAKATGGAE